jgi:hypothetical protein
MQYNREKKDGTLVTVLQAYVHPNNKKWLEEESAKLKMKVSPYLDQLLTFVRKNGLPGFMPQKKQVEKDGTPTPGQS